MGFPREFGTHSVAPLTPSWQAMEVGPVCVVFVQYTALYSVFSAGSRARNSEGSLKEVYLSQHNEYTITRWEL